MPEEVILTEVKSTPPVGTSRKPNRAALTVPAEGLPAAGVPVLSMDTTAEMVCWLPAAVPNSWPVVVTSFDEAMLPVNVAPPAAPAATLAISR